MAQNLQVNGRARRVDVEPEMPLLWVLRDELKLLGTKYGCGIGECGACTVLIDGAAVRSCTLPVSAAVGKKITIELQVPQCGYCQSGMLLAAAALLAKTLAPSDADIDREITNICRCGTYPRIRAAIHRAAAKA